METCVILSKLFSISVPHVYTIKRKIVEFPQLEVTPYEGCLVCQTPSLPLLYQYYNFGLGSLDKRVRQVLLLFQKGCLGSALVAMSCCDVSISNPVRQPLKENKDKDFPHLLSQWG